MLTKPTQAETVYQSSSLVLGFERVSVATGLTCPHCGRAFGAHDLRRDGDELRLRCAGCERDAVVVTLAISEEAD
jgi:hypothetical protein